MDKSTLQKYKVFVSEIFRTPLSAEKEIGLWIDRIGISSNSAKPGKLRILGLYAAVCVESGKGLYYSDASGEIEVNAGDTIIVFPDVPHMYYSEKKWDTRFVVWSGPEAVKLEQLGFLPREKPVIPGSADAVVEANKTLLEIVNREDLSSILARKNIALDMILKLHQRCESGEKRRPTDLTIEKTIAYMRANYQKTISVNEYAGYANLSETHFRRLFRQYAGRSPKEFLISLRISKAKELLSRGVPIKEAAVLAGWEDEFYFMRIFKKISGISPGRFRNN